MAASSKGFTLIELLIVVAIIGIIAAIAIPGLLRSRIAGNEASAIGSLRAILSAQEDFASTGHGFADKLETLASICPHGRMPFLSPDLGSNGVDKSGYLFTVVAAPGAASRGEDCFETPTVSAYFASAVPRVTGVTGGRGFGADIRNAIWQHRGGEAPWPLEPSADVTPLGQ